METVINKFKITYILAQMNWISTLRKLFSAKKTQKTP